MKRLSVAGLVLALLAQPMAVAGEDTTDTAWLPGAAMRYEKLLDRLDLRKTDVAGEYRLAGDGFHEKWYWVNRIVIGPDGAMWLQKHAGGDDIKVFRAGKRVGWTRGEGVERATLRGTTPSGTPVLSKRSKIGLLEGGQWEWIHRVPLDVGGAQVADNGSAWVSSGDRVARYDGADWTILAPEDMAITMTLPFDEGEVTGLERTPDGSVWVGMADRNRRPAGLARFDGDGWSEVAFPGFGERFAVAAMDAGRDGSLWVRVIPERDHERKYLARWDGDSWAAWTLPAWLQDRWGSYGQMTVAPDGRLWFADPLVVFDGATWSRYETPGPRWIQPKNRRVGSLAFAPDGNVWMLAPNSRRGSAVLLLDLDRVEPVSVEPATVYERTA